MARPFRLSGLIYAIIAFAILAVPVRAKAENTSVTIAVSSTSLAYGGMQIALQGGLFQKHGLDPKIVVMDSGNTAISAVVSGSVELSAAGVGEVLAARVRGVDVVIVSNVYRGLGGSIVLAKSVADKMGGAPSGAVEPRLRALDGMAIATSSPTSAYTTPFSNAARAAGAKIKWVYMPQPAMGAALRVGAIQGMSAGAPFSVAPVLDGSGVLWISGPRGDLPTADLPTSSTCLQTSLAYAVAHPETIRALRATFEEVADMIKAQPENAKALLGKAYPQLDSRLLDAVFAESSSNWSQPKMTSEDIRKEIGIQIGASTLPGVEKLDPGAVLLPW